MIGPEVDSRSARAVILDFIFGKIHGATASPSARAPRAEAYLLLARHNDDGRPLHLDISSSPTMASHGPWYYTRVDRPYATTIATTFDDAQAKLRRAMLLDPEPWPEDMQPLVQELLKPPEAADLYRTDGQRVERCVTCGRPVEPLAE